MNNKLLNKEVYLNLPNSIKRLTDRFSGREKDIVLLSTIGALSSCLPKVYGIYDGKKVYANLYVMVIAPPASGKGVMNYARDLVNPIHKKVFNESLSELEDCSDAKKKKKSKGEFQGDCPPLVAKIIPGNISAAEMYPTIKNSHYGGIIIESEADTLSVMLNQDWGNFSDILRKAFHHEPVSISRKMDNLYIDIDEPQLSLVLSGTPDQLQPLVKSKDNGLFSRMMFYYFNEVSEWKNVFKPESRNLKNAFEEAGKEVFNLYGFLVNLEKPREFILTGEQEELLNTEMSRIYSMVKESHPQGFTSIVKRHGLILYRISMILSAFRVGREIEHLKELPCSDVDFQTALVLTKQLLHHADSVSQNVSLGYLSENDDNFLFSLNEIFTRKQAIEKAKIFDIPERTVDEKLQKWRELKILRKISHGKYKRILG